MIRLNREVETPGSACSLDRLARAALVLLAAGMLFLPVARASSTWTQTTDAAFNGGTKSRVVVTGTGVDGAVVLEGAHFAYKRPVTIDNSLGAALTDYQVRIVLDGGNFDFPKAQPDGDDVRFLDSDETTLLSYYSDLWDSPGQKAVLWVKVPAIPAGSTKTIYLYYGNSSVGGDGNGSATFDLFDDFDSLVSWSQSGSGISMADGTVTLNNANLTNPSLWRDFSIASPLIAEVKYRHPSRLRNRLYLAPNSGTGLGYDYGIFDPSLYWHNEWTGINLDLNTWYLIRWENRSDDFIWRVLHLDGTEVLHRSSGFAIANAQRLSFAATDQANSVFTVDWARIRKYASSEPTITVGAEESGLDKLIYASTGEFVSSAFDTGEFSSFQTLEWDGEVPAGTALKFQVRTANTEAELTSASWYGPTSPSDFYVLSGTAINPVHNAKRWVQYKASFGTVQSGSTAALRSVSINYDLADVTISSNTAWPEGAYQIVNLTVNNGATLSIAGGSTVAVSGTITVTGNSTILLQGKNTAGQFGGQWAGVGVTLRAGNITVDSGSKISADGQGYETSQGPGAGPAKSDGGSYGGRGGANSGPTYGSALIPVDLGSGGGSDSDGWSHGGGAIRLEVAGALTVNGEVTTSGTIATSWWATNVSGGSGGSIYVTAGALSGAGKFSANGASGPYYGVGGGGGRIAVFYATGSGFTGFSSSKASAGSAREGYPVAQDGTVVFFDTTESHLRVAAQRFELGEETTVSYGAVTVENGGTLVIGGGSAIDIGGTLTVTGNSTILLQGKNTTAKVNGKWAGEGVTLRAANVVVAAGSKISADGQGYVTSQGPGAGPTKSDGGSYGGRGGANSGPTYGSGAIPTDLGSGGGADSDGWSHGGGAIRLEVGGTLTLNGEVTADGMIATSWWATSVSGGSGGSIYVIAGTLTGSGHFTADGAAGPYYGTGGGGGRIAVYYGEGTGFGGYGASTASAGPVRDTIPVAQDGTVVFLNTTENHLKVVARRFELGEDTAASFGAITVESGGTLVIGGGSVIDIGGTLTLTGSSIVLLQGKNTTARVNGQWAGEGVTLRAANVVVAAGSKISADGQGYVTSQGPGAGPTKSDGGSYGGRGGANSGPTYGSGAIPTDLGSGGGADSDVWSHGGGAIRLEVGGTLTVDGEITADGLITTSWWASAVSGGSGGSIYVIAGTLTGSGSFSANGGCGSVLRDRRRRRPHRGLLRGGLGFYGVCFHGGLRRSGTGRSSRRPGRYGGLLRHVFAQPVGVHLSALCH